MHIIIALRLFNQPHAKMGIEQRDKTGKPLGHLVEIHVDRMYPALKNIIGFHQQQGSIPPLREGEVLEEDGKGGYQVARKMDCRLYWCLIETERPQEFWEKRPEVELVIPYDEFQRLTQSIRGRVGTHYINACDEFARQMAPNSQRPIRYQPPSRPREDEALVRGIAAAVR